MTLDPRIEAALVEFTRTKLPPPGYVLRDCRNARYDVHVIEPWSVTCGEWSHSDKTETGAIAAAWAHSDRRHTMPPGYRCLANGYGQAQAVRGQWQTELLPSVVEACEAAWDHHDREVARAEERSV